MSDNKEPYPDEIEYLNQEQIEKLIITSLAYIIFEKYKDEFVKSLKIFMEMKEKK